MSWERLGLNILGRLFRKEEAPLFARRVDETIVTPRMIREGEAFQAPMAAAPRFIQPPP
jgi:hypothetical protein